MLYRGSEITREVAWVIFDEIHYLRDKGLGTKKVFQIKKIKTTFFLSFRTWCDMGRNNYFITG
jgi:hypothetical protein